MNSFTSLLKISLSTGVINSWAAAYSFTVIAGIEYNASKSMIYVNDNGTQLVSIQVGGSNDGVATLMTLKDASNNAFSFDGTVYRLTSDGNNTLYAASSSGSNAGTIYSVTLSTGVVNTVKKNDGTPLLVSGSPNDICHDHAHTLYFGDVSSPTLSIVDLNAKTVTTKNASSVCSQIDGIIHNNGLLYIAAGADDGLLTYTIATETFAFIAGPRMGFLDANGAAAAFYGNRSVALVGSYLYMTDGANNAIRQIGTSSPYPVRTFASNLPTDPSNLSLTSTDTSITVSFGPPSNASEFGSLSYQIIDYDTVLQTYTTTTVTSSPFIITGLTTGVSHDITITAIVTGPNIPGVPLTASIVTSSGGGGSRPNWTFNPPAGPPPNWTFSPAGAPPNWTFNPPVVGASGDPYVTTFSGIHYKLPVIDAPIRYFQTVEEGALLTINAQLKTVSSSELDITNFHSLLSLRNKLTPRQYAEMSQKILTPQTLSFFERVSIQHGEERLVLNLWNSTFEVLENTSSAKAEIVKRPDLIKASGIYTGYKSTTVQLTFGSTKVFLSVYNSPMIRNGLYVESPCTNANGVIVNALKQSDMVLPSLSSVKPVPTVNSAKPVTIKETFVDHDGLRTRNVITYR
jgi:hypothetical protein